MEPALVQLDQARQEPAQRLAAAGGRDQQRVAALRARASSISAWWRRSCQPRAANHSAKGAERTAAAAASISTSDQAPLDDPARAVAESKIWRSSVGNGKTIVFDRSLEISARVAR